MNTHVASSNLLLSSDDRQFITAHLDQNIDQLVFKLPRTEKSKLLLHQIQARKKIKHKVPSWFANDALIMPQSISLEQCSSEATALFKQSLLAGNTLMDLTGGMGIDTSFLAKNFQSTIHFEQQEELSQLAAHNFKVLGLDTISCLHANAIDYLLQHPSSQADWLYIDPARRDEAQRKVFHLSDCTPDVVQHQALLSSIAPAILIKTSPVLDIDLTLRQLHNVAAVYCIGYDNECKEVLYVLRNNESISVEHIPIHAVIIDEQGRPLQQFSFTRAQEQNCAVEYSAPLSYLYEPHAAVLKTGALKYLTSLYGLQKLSINSHLYTSSTLVNNFPGRVFKVKAIVKPDAKAVKEHLTDDLKANLTVRNFPASVSDLRKKLRLKEGGDQYLFATTLHNQQKVVLITDKYNFTGTF